MKHHNMNGMTHQIKYLYVQVVYPNFKVVYETFDTQYYFIIDPNGDGEILSDHSVQFPL